MSIDWTKPILWDGKPARVLATDMKNDLPILIAVFERGKEHLAYCDIQGRDCYRDQRVTNAPERVERWVNVYGPGCTSTQHPTRELADLYGGARTALVRYTFEGDKLVDVAIVPLEDGA